MVIASVAACLLPARGTVHPAAPRPAQAQVQLFLSTPSTTWHRAIEPGRVRAPSVISDTTAQLMTARLPARLIALRWAKTQAGAPYVWGGSGPYWSGYDCSGLVVAAYARAGISLPHNTVAMLYSGHLRWEPRSDARWGDVVMWGGAQPFHEEMFNGYGGELTWGAHEQGTVVGYGHQLDWWYWNENFYRVV